MGLAGFASKQPVLFADGGGADGIFRQIMVDWHPAVLGEPEEFFPLPEGIGDGQAGEALRQVVAPRRQVVEPGFDLLENGQAVGLAFAADDAGSGAAVSQAGFNPVEILDLQEEPRGVFALRFGFEKFAPHAGHASGQLEGVSGSGALFGEGVTGIVAIALNEAFEAGGDDALETAGAAPGAPGEVAQVPHRIVKAPEVAGATDAFSFRVLVFDDWRFFRLEIAVREDFVPGGGEDAAAGFGRHVGPG